MDRIKVLLAGKSSQVPISTYFEHSSGFMVFKKRVILKTVAEVKESSYSINRKRGELFFLLLMRIADQFANLIPD